MNFWSWLLALLLALLFITALYFSLSGRGCAGCHGSGCSGCAATSSKKWFRQAVASGRTRAAVKKTPK